MADDHVLDGGGRNPDRDEPLANRVEQHALALFAHGGVEASVDDEGAVRTNDRPHVVIERLHDVVRIAAEEILGRAALVVCVADRVDLVHVRAHAIVPSNASPGRHALPGPCANTSRAMRNESTAAGTPA